jgi:tetratricopeptide (TPR) repeat protein
LLTLRTFIDRLLGKTTPPLQPQEAEMRQLVEQGNQARREHNLTLALAKYEEGLTLARQHGASIIEEVILGLIGAVYTDQKDYPAAEAVFQTALESAEKSLAAAAGSSDAQAKIRLARAQLNLGAYHLRHNDLDRAFGLLDLSLKEARAQKDLPLIGLALGNIADVYLKQNNPAYALRLLREAAPQVIQNSQQAPYVIGRMGQAHQMLKEYDPARKLLFQASQLAEQFAQPEQEVLWLSVLADLLYGQSQFEESLRLYQRAETVSAKAITLPEEFNLIENLVRQASIQQRLNNPAQALAQAERALVLAKAAAPSQPKAEAALHGIIGSVHAGNNQRPQAIAAYDAALSLYRDQARDSDEHNRVLLALGNLYQDDGKEEAALAYFEEALKVAGNTDKSGRAQVLRRIGAMSQNKADYTGAIEKWNEALALFESAGERTMMARVLCDIGSARRIVSGINAAMTDYEKAIVLLGNVRDSATRGLVLSNMASIYTDMGEIETAKTFYEESIQLAQQTKDHRSEALRVGNFGWYYVMIGQPKQAITLLERALAMSRELQSKLYVAVQTNNLAQAHHELKEYSKAEQLTQSALADVDAQSKWGAIFQANLARIYLAQQRNQEAADLLVQAQQSSRQHNDREALSRCLARLAEARLRLGLVSEAETAANEGFAIATKIGYRKGQADNLLARAQVAEAKNDLDSRDRHQQEAWRLYNILHDPLGAALATALKK